MKENPVLKSMEHFLFDMPLYAVHNVPWKKEEDNRQILIDLYARRKGSSTVDGHCPFCHMKTTFRIKGQYLTNQAHWESIQERVCFDTMSIVCSRNEKHEIDYWFLINKLTIQKVGQYPSLATIANDGAAPYRKYMDEDDAEEFYKAVGLAAHGVGVGSFVYLRRVFERLINKRFEEFKSTENWIESDFYKSRMEEKISILKEHLPEFLVNNRMIYSILSKGIHELDENSCLSYFDVMQRGVLIILQDDEKKREDLQHRRAFENAIAAIKSAEK